MRVSVPVTVVRHLAVAATVALLAACDSAPPAPKLTYPPTTKGDVVTDYNGTKVADPYRWMESLDAKDVAEWIAAENAVTAKYFETLTLVEPFRKRITELWNYPKVSVPVREGGRFFYQKNTGLQRQSPVFYRSTLTGAPTLAVDPNIISPEGTTSLAQWRPAPSGQLIAYGLAEGGADWRTIHVRDLEAQQDMPDEVRWMRFSDISWTKDSKGFFYSRYPEPPKGKVLEAALSGQAIYYHRVGTPQAEDELIYQR